MSRPSIDLFEYRDGHLRWKTKSTGRSRNDGRVGYLDREDGYYRFKYEGKRYTLHRYIWEFFNGPIPEGFFIDHIDGDKTNNSPGNLRLATNQQNQFNRKSKGISWDKVNCKWKATIYIEGRHLHTKRFSKYEDALSYRKGLEQEYHGEFAYVE